jgi:hypothetical protein
MSLDDLKSKLNEFIHQYEITKFETEDVIELVSEGESIDWIVDQLKGDKQLDVDAIASLLKEIQSEVRPAKEPEAGETLAAPAGESETPDISPEDISQLDMAQISKMLPQGMKLPPGFNVNELKSLIESPQGQVMTDFMVFCQEKGIDLDKEGMNKSQTERLQKEWMSTPRDSFEGKTPAEMLAQAQGKIETFRREEPRIGRNDPCPCRSGKKYKKCCGRA